jgi:hypothetical protein
MTFEDNHTYLQARTRSNAHIWPNHHLRVLALANRWAGFDVWDTDTYIDIGNPKKVIASNARRAVAVFLRGHGYSFISISDIMGQSITCIKMFCEPSNRDRCAEALEKLTEWMK